MAENPAVLITGASSGIGATYADRFARRGNDLVLVARDKERMQALAARLRDETGVAVEVLQADLTKPMELAAVELRLRDDRRIGVLVNNAGAALGGTFLAQAADDVGRIVALNTTAVVRLASAVAPRFVEVGEGAIINISSAVGLAPELGMSVYGATKAFVTFLSQGLSLELGASECSELMFKLNLTEYNVPLACSADATSFLSHIDLFLDLFAVVTRNRLKSRNIDIIFMPWGVERKYHRHLKFAPLKSAE
jgi:short-subunit dehydrogenase